MEEARKACRAKMNEYCAKTLFGIRGSQEENMITLAKLMELLQTPEEFNERYYSIVAQMGLCNPAIKELRWLSQGGALLNLLELMQIVGSRHKLRE